MFARQTSKNLRAAKRVEQQAVATALKRVTEAHHIREGRLAAAIDALSARPNVRRFGAVLRAVRQALAKERSPFLRDCALAIFVGAPLLEALQRAVVSLPQPATTVDLFTTTRQAAEAYVARSGHSLCYSLCHPRFLWNSWTGTYLGGLLLGRISPFDPKGFGGNSSGFLFKEKFSGRHGASLDIDWTVGPTPTVGGKIAPEAAAAIEAIHDRSSSCFPHVMWVYVNLQSMRWKAEGDRSHVLFTASQGAPSAFRLASVSVDAPFYYNCDQALIPLREHRKLLLSELKKGLIPSRSSWYAFSLQDGERDQWWHCVEHVVEKAFCLASMTDHQIPVFHELVVLGLVRAWQGFCCRIAGGSVMSTIACKECVDRGGSVNAAFTWAFFEGSDEERARAVQAVLWGRPLLSRQRLIEKPRTRGFEALARSLMPAMVRRYLEEVWDESCHRRWRPLPRP